MIKNWKKATALAVLLWILIFVAYSIVMFIPGIGPYLSYLTIIIGPIMVLICGYLYFSQVPGRVLDGLVIGIYWLIIGTILDLIITVPLFVKSYSSYYGNWMLWFGFALSVIAAIVSPLIFKKRV